MAENICVLGIDPGMSGALAFYFTQAPHTVAAEDVPLMGKVLDAATLGRRIRQMAPSFAVIESVGARPGQGVSSMFKFGQAYGTAIGVLGALNVPVVYVSSGKWKKHFGLPSSKEAARARAINTWPERSELFERVKDHGRAEAALLALYGAQTEVR